MKELETDRKRKVSVVFVLYFFSLLAVLAVYLSNTDFAEIEKWIVDALQAEMGGDDEDFID